MGLFGDIARAAANAALSTAKDMIGDAAAAKIGQQVGVGKSISFRGECERTVYVYYGEPLRKIRKGDVFDAEVVTKPMRLRSELTGGVWDTTDNGFALAYKGKVFGAASALGNTFKDITELGYRITVSCRMTGWYAKGIPTVVMMIDEPEEIFAWLDACKGLGRDVSFEERHSPECESAALSERTRLELSKACGRELPVGVDGDCVYIEDDKWTGMRKSGVFPVEVSTELIPTPRGSTAKPHVAVFVDGAMAADVSARCVHYKTLAEHAGERPYFACCQKREGHDGFPIWRVTVVYLGR
ncbi:MAG: hypothetical protein DBX94_05325 [Coriobacteriia bacterium]|jgi:hypothetical protein|uniref:hypothetical protein n=1 Tax=Collinsella aerofaciens TaxID=74426 RepID=UPI000D792CB7|nr:MAG: hypothetical protein DBX94_05325 [Coriobacteriia bacterium]